MIRTNTFQCIYIFFPPHHLFIRCDVALPIDCLSIAGKHRESQAVCYHSILYFSSAAVDQVYEEHCEVAAGSEGKLPVSRSSIPHCGQL